MTHPKLLVLDDDPTGSQTVHGCLLLLRWDVDTLRLALADASPLLFILGNTRARTPAEAAQITQEICRNLRQVVGEDLLLKNYLIISRSDSTLRGHYPLEIEVMNRELGEFDAHLLIPAFMEGGRITRDSVHYLLVQGTPVPVDQTEFAKDSVFGYHSAYLPAYVEEKTGGRINSQKVTRFTLDKIRSGCDELLLNLHDNACGVVDAVTQEDLNLFAQALYRTHAQGKRFLLRSAAGIISALAQLPPQPVAPELMSSYVQGTLPGVVIVGSHVQLSTRQVRHLLQQEYVRGIELEITQLLQGKTPLEVVEIAVESITPTLNQGLIPVIYTPREELQFPDTQTRLNFGRQVAQVTSLLVHHLPAEIGFLVSKGGITSNEILSHGLDLTAVRLLGQIAPGINVIRTPKDHPQFPDLPVVIVPGNVGDEAILTTIVQRLNPRQA